MTMLKLFRLRIAAVCGLILVLTGARSLEAQDFLKLHDGKQMRGEIISETEDEFRIISRLGVMQVVAKADVLRSRKGRGLNKVVQKKLDATEKKTAAELFKVVEWAATKKSLRRDAERLARRVLVMEKDHAGARKLLGHVKALNTWYETQEEAVEAVTDVMTKNGYVYQSGGWVRAERAADLAAKPEEWLLIDNFKWRPLAEVMTERGFTLFHKTWYPAEEKHLIPFLEELRKRTGEIAYAAEEPGVRVFSVQDRDSAREQAKNLVKARTWFTEKFGVNPRYNKLLKEPMAHIYVLSSQETLKKFHESYGKSHQFFNAEMTMRLKHLLWEDLGMAIHVGESIWPNQLVAQLGGRLSGYIWKGKMEAPPWLWVACAHKAEIAVFGQARVQFVAKSKYAEASAEENFSVRNIRDGKKRLKDAYKGKECKGMRQLYGTPFNGLNVVDDMMGVVLFDYMFEEHKDLWMRFIKKDRNGAMAGRFEAVFGKSFEVFEEGFKKWVGVK